MSKKIAVIMAGPSGAGKSTYARNNFPNHQMCSTDNFFMEDGEYKFDPRKLGEFHKLNKAQFLDLCQNGALVGCDNTNVSISQIAWYVDTALLFGYDVHVFAFVAKDSTLEICAKRNAHGVPANAIKRMNNNIKKMVKNWPPFWPYLNVMEI